jgi:hypothetical protein
MDWNVAIKEWEEQVKAKYTETHISEYNGKEYSDLKFPEQDITVLYNGKELCHYNGDYSNGCIKKAMAKTFTGKGKNRVEQEIDN